MPDSRATPMARSEALSEADGVVPESRLATNAAAELVTAPLRLAQAVLPSNGLPVYLAAGALGVAEVVEWPTVLVIALSCSAIKRWKPAIS